MLATHIPATHIDPRLPGRNFTVPIPDTHVIPGFYTSNAFQAPATPTYGPQSGAAQMHPDRQRDRTCVPYSIQ